MSHDIAKAIRTEFTAGNPLPVGSGDAIQKYQLSDGDETGGYYGYVDLSGAWYIQKITTTSVISVRYAAGDGNYPEAWINRATQTYNYYNEAF